MSARALRIGISALVPVVVFAACVREDGTESRTSIAAEATPTELQEATTTAVIEEIGTTEVVSVGSDCAEGITVGVITDETGPLAIYGAHVLRSIPIGFEYATGAVADDDAYAVGGCRLRVVYRDDRSDPDLSAAAARELIEEEGASILIGSVSSSATASLQEIALAEDVILIATPAAGNDLTGVTFNEHTFRAGRTYYQDSIAICQYMTREHDTFVQAATDHPFGLGGASAYRDACTFFGGAFPGEDVVSPPNTANFTSMMEAIVDTDAEVLLVTWPGAGFAALYQAAVDLGVLETKVLVSPFIDNISLPAFFSNAIGTTSLIPYHYSLPDNPINDFMVAKAQEVGVYPDLFDADGMTAAIMVVEALRATGGDASAAALIGALERMEFEGPKGTVNIRPEDHVAIQDLYIVTLLNIDDPDFMFYEYVETLRPEPPCLLSEDLVDRCGALPVGSLDGS